MAGVRRADAIMDQVGGIHGAVTQTRDNSVWDRIGGLIETGFWALIIVGGCVAIVYIGSQTGLLALVGGWIRIVTPAKRREASLIVDTLDDGSPETVRELIAARRASDPVLDRAIEAEKQRRQRRPAPSSPRKENQS